MRKHELYYEAESEGRIRTQPIFTATTASHELDELGKRLDQIRWTLKCSTSDWAKNHWAQAEAQLLRRIRRVNQELSCN